MTTRILKDLSQLVTRAPETGNGAGDVAATADGKADVKAVKERVATHELLDASGAVVDDEELASGIRYTLNATGKSFDFQVPGAQPGSVTTMLAIFGAKTLATNEASQVRQKDDTGDQLGAIQERFELLATGKWVDRTGGVGAKVDLDALAQAIANAFIAKGKTVEVSVVRTKLDADKVWAKQTRQVPEIAAEYASIVGRTVKSVDDVFAAL